MSHRDIIPEVYAKAGGIQELSRALGCSFQAVWKWQQRGQVPVKRVVQVERLTGIPREKLRPDIFGRQAA